MIFVNGYHHSVLFRFSFCCSGGQRGREAPLPSEQEDMHKRRRTDIERFSKRLRSGAETLQRTVSRSVPFPVGFPAFAVPRPVRAIPRVSTSKTISEQVCVSVLVPFCCTPFHLLNVGLRKETSFYPPHHHIQHSSIRAPRRNVFMAAFGTLPLRNVPCSPPPLAAPPRKNHVGKDPIPVHSNQATD